jgi:HK97 family phage major capsid protein
MDYAKQLMESGKTPMLYGYPVAITNNIPNNLTSSYSEVYFFDASTCLIGNGMRLSVEVFPNGTYYNGSSVVSGISTDETVIRALLEVDFVAKYDKGISVIHTVDWGA